MTHLARFFAPVCLLAVSAYVGWVNTGHERRIVFPLLDRVVADVDTQGQLPLLILLGLSLLAGVLALRQGPAERDRGSEPPASD